MFEIWLYHEAWGGFGTLVLLFCILLLFIMRIVFLTTLQRIIEQMDPNNIDFNPVWHWLSLLPVVHYIFDIFLIFRYRQMLQTELEERKLDLKHIKVMFWSGLAYCTLSLVMLFDERLFSGLFGISAQICGLICLGILIDLRNMLKKNNIKNGKISYY